MQIDLTAPSSVNTVDLSAPSSVNPVNSTALTQASNAPSTVNVIIPIPVSNSEIPQLNFSNLNCNSAVATINTTHTVALTNLPTDAQKTNIQICHQNPNQHSSDSTIQVKNNVSVVQISPIRRPSEETTKWIYEEWERRTLVIEETLQSIDKIFSSSQHQIELTTSIDTLITQVKVIEELYHKIRTKLSVPEEYLCSKYPKKKAKSYVLALCSGASSLIGIGSMAIEGLQAQYRCNATINWIGVGFLIGGAVMGKASLFFSNAWGNEEKEKGRLKEIASKASIITNTRATIRIFEEYNRFVKEEKHQKNKEMVKEKIGKLLRNLADKKERKLESPLLKLDRRLRTIFHPEMDPLQLEFNERKKGSLDRKLSDLDDEEEDSLSQIVYERPLSNSNLKDEADTLKIIKIEEIDSTPIPVINKQANIIQLPLSAPQQDHCNIDESKINENNS